ncbi:MAG TPA: hypothetical protein VFH56_12055 [Acidimicrobiales bacterium]|nr:hypothetical protein [Acidimicrobiales bacterium]
MAAPVASPPASQARAAISARTLRTDRWWVPTLTSGSVLFGFIVYATWAALQNADYFARPYISPLYSPCIASLCNHARSGSVHNVHVPNVGIVGTWWPYSAAILILAFPGLFRATCYYYRKAYYRSFLLSPPGCAVAEPRKKYTGESRFPLILQNVHRYFFYIAVLFAAINAYDAVVAFRDTHDRWGHMGFGTLVLVANAVMLTLYTVSCHSCRHIIGGRLKHFSRHPIRFRLWGWVSVLNRRHMELAWISLVVVALADVYVRLVASGTITDPRFF